MVLILGLVVVGLVGIVVDDDGVVGCSSPPPGLWTSAPAAPAKPPMGFLTVRTGFRTIFNPLDGDVGDVIDGDVGVGIGVGIGVADAVVAVVAVVVVSKLIPSIP